MISFLYSSLFQTLITLFVGLFAIWIYYRQKRDYKSDAANSILLEIQNAERVISRVRESVRTGRLDTDITVMRSDSWGKYSYLFSRDFDRDEWDSITDFYNKSKLLDEAIRFNNTFFTNDVEQIRANRQKILAEYAKKLIDDAESSAPPNPDEVLNKFNQKLEVFDQLYMEKQNQFMYNPQKPINDAKIYIEDLKSLTTTSVGQKLKKLSRTR